MLWNCPIPGIPLHNRPLPIFDATPFAPRRSRTHLIPSPYLYNGQGSESLSGIFFHISQCTMSLHPSNNTPPAIKNLLAPMMTEYLAAQLSILVPAIRRDGWTGRNFQSKTKNSRIHRYRMQYGSINRHKTTTTSVSRNQKFGSLTSVLRGPDLFAFTVS